MVHVGETAVHVGKKPRYMWERNRGTCGRETMVHVGETAVHVGKNRCTCGKEAAVHMGEVNHRGF